MSDTYQNFPSTIDKLSTGLTLTTGTYTIGASNIAQISSNQLVVRNYGATHTIVVFPEEYDYVKTGQKFRLAMILGADRNSGHNFTMSGHSSHPADWGGDYICNVSSNMAGEISVDLSVKKIVSVNNTNWTICAVFNYSGDGSANGANSEAWYSIKEDNSISGATGDYQGIGLWAHGIFRYQATLGLTKPLFQTTAGDTGEPEIIPYSEFSELKGNVTTADFVLDDGTSYQLNSTTLGFGNGGKPSYLGGSWTSSFSGAPVDTLAFIGLNQDIDVFINYGDGTRLRYRVYLNDSQGTDPDNTNISSKHGGNADILYVIIRPANSLPASTAPDDDTDTGGDTGGDTGTDTGGDTGGDTGTDTDTDTGTDTGTDTVTDTDTDTDTGGDATPSGVNINSILYKIGLAIKSSNSTSSGSVSALDTRVTALETEIDGGLFS